MAGTPSSRQTARGTLQQWLYDGNIPGLNQVLLTFPKILDFQVNAQAGQMSRAAAVIFILRESESRIAVGGAHDGWKRVDYTINLQVFHHSLHRNATDAMNDFDILIDGIKARLRSDHNFGDETGTLVWQGAEPDIDTLYGEPVLTEAQAVETYAEMQFTITQMIRA